MRPIRVFCISLLLLSSPAIATTLGYAVPRTGSAHGLILRRDGATLVLADRATRAILASTSAAETDRVSIQGADHDDDSLTVDLAQPILLRGGIDYDGGTDGWDTLNVSGGSARAERITQLTPHDGNVDIDGLVVRYTNLEPLIDTVPAASLTVVGTAGADTVTISDGPSSGQATISSPTFEGVTFANKTTVIFDGMGGGDSFNFDNPTPAAGLSTLVVRNVAEVSQTAPVFYAALGISANSLVTLNARGNDVANVEIVTQSGSIDYEASGDVTIGGVSPDLTGMRVVDSGGVSLIAGGKVTLSDTDGTDVVSSGTNSGGVYLISALDVVATVDNAAVAAPAGGIDILCGRDLLLGTQGVTFRNDVRAALDSRLSAQRDLILAGHSNVVGARYAQLGAGRDVTVAGSAALSATSGSVGIYAVNGNLNLGVDGVAVAATQLVTLESDHLHIGSASGVTGGYMVQIVTRDVGIDIGASADSPNAMAFSSAESARIETSHLSLNAGGGGVTVSAPLSVPYELDLLSSNGFTVSGAGSLSAPALGFAVGGQAPRRWTVDESGITISPGARIPYGGVAKLTLSGGDGEDTFDLTPSATMAIQVYGDGPNPPASPGDTLYVSPAGAEGSLFVRADAGGYSGDYFFTNRSRIHFDLIETLEPSTDLCVTMTDGVRNAFPGASLTYTITASNSGTAGISGASVYDSFDAGLKNVRWTCSATAGSSCRAAGSGSLGEYIDLAAGGSAIFVVTVDVDPAAAGSVTNIAGIGPPGFVFDVNSSNDIATDIDVIGALADLSVTATSTQASYRPGGTIAYTITVGNAGPDAAANVMLVDTLPPNTTFASLTAPAEFTCNTPAAGSSGTITCTATSVPVSTNTFGLVVNVAATTSGQIVDSATVSSTSNDLHGTNNVAAVSIAAAAAVTVAATPLLSLAMLLLLLLAFATIALLRLQRMR